MADNAPPQNFQSKRDDLLNMLQNSNYFFNHLSCLNSIEAEFQTGPPVKWVTEIFKQIAKLFQDRRPLVKYSILNFLNNTKKYLTMIRDPDFFLSHFEAGLKDDSVSQRSFTYRALALLSSIIKPNSVLLVYIIDGLKSPNKEEAEIAKQSFKVLCSNLPSFGNSLSESIPIEQYFEFIPFLSQEPLIIKSVIQVLSTNLNLQNPNLFSVIKVSVNYVKTIKIFPYKLFDSFLILVDPPIDEFQTRLEQHHQAENLNQSVHENYESFFNGNLICHVLSSLVITSKYLSEEQQHELAQLCINCLFPQNDSLPPINMIYPLQLISSLKITDPSLLNLTPPNLQACSLFVLSIPSIEEAGNIVIQKIKNCFYEDKTINVDGFHLLLKGIRNLLRCMNQDSIEFLWKDFIPTYLNDEAFQCYIASFLEFLPIEIAKNFCQPYYESVTLIPYLKSVVLKLRSSFNMELKFTINPPDFIICASKMLEVGDFVHASQYLTFAEKTSNTEPNLEPLRLFAEGELAASKGQFSKAASDFSHASNTFTLISSHNNFQSKIAKIKYYLLSLSLQVQVLSTYPPLKYVQDDMNVMLNSQNSNLFQIDSYMNYLDGVMELKQLLQELPYSSLLVCKEFDPVSAEMVNNYVEQVTKYLDVLEKDPNQFAKIIAEKMNSLPLPPAFFRNDYPYTVHNVNLPTSSLKLNENEDSYFYISVTGELKKSPIFTRSAMAYIDVIIDESIRPFQTPQPITEEGKFEVFFPIILKSIGRSYRVSLAFNFSVWIDDNQYLIASVTKYLFSIHVQ